MKIIWKCDLTGQLNAHTNKPFKITLNMPFNAKIICIRNDNNGKPCVWFEFQEGQLAKVNRTFYTMGTGWGNVPDDSIYLGTVFEGAFVWHIYEAKR